MKSAQQNRDEAWWAYRKEMSNYMPTMIAFKRKRSGWKRTAENFVVWLLVLLIVGLEIVGIVYTTAHWHWNPAFAFFGALVLDWKLSNWILEFVYYDDSGPHNLAGFDPATRTIPGPNGTRRSTDQFWYKKPPSKKRK